MASEKVFEHPSKPLPLSLLPPAPLTELLLLLISLLDRPFLKLSMPYDVLLFPWPT